MESEGSDMETMMLGNGGGGGGVGGGLMHHHRARGVITEIRDRDDVRGSGLMEEMIDDEEREERSSESGGFGGWRSHIFGGLQRVKSWYWGARPLVSPSSFSSYSSSSSSSTFSLNLSPFILIEPSLLISFTFFLFSLSQDFLFSSLLSLSFFHLSLSLSSSHS